MQTHPILWHPLALNSFRHWIRLLTKGRGIDAPHGMAVAFFVSLVSPMTAPFRMWERLSYESLVEQQELNAPPVFIIGHWRSGTTHLHNLLCQDPAFSYVTMTQTQAPNSFLVGVNAIRPLVRFFMPERRPMDNMALSPDVPQEEELALCNITMLSPYVGWYFPHLLKECFQKAVLLEGITETERQAWKQAYQSILRKAAIHGHGGQLLLKNPANTARIPLLLEMYPDAKFVHIRRNPYIVFKSTQRLHRKMIDMLAFQRIGDAEIEEAVLSFYEEMMQRYLDERHLIPPGHLIEITFEDLDAHPLEELERVYAGLNFSGWQEARSQMEAYLGKCKGYRKNAFTLHEIDIQKVETCWKFALDQWPYPRPMST